MCRARSRGNRFRKCPQRAWRRRKFSRGTATEEEKESTHVDVRRHGFLSEATRLWVSRFTRAETSRSIVRPGEIRPDLFPLSVEYLLSLFVRGRVAYCEYVTERLFSSRHRKPREVAKCGETGANAKFSRKTPWSCCEGRVESLRAASSEK